MTVYHAIAAVHSPLHKPMFHDVTHAAKDAVAQSGVSDGIVTVYSQHTTCSVIIQEESHDRLYDGTEHLLQDLLDRLETLIPTCRHEGQYLHPGPKHIQHAVEDLGEEAVWSLNTDAHLRSCLVGRSETIPIVGGAIQLGEFGRIYFVDFDGVRARDRTVQFQVLGE
ncbi:MAG TPA: secondary thiamine-phosphate synthase enzyme YjbQ [Candidatus Binatus sp.]|nr:secondary thiamine-phosphate synthase enzyme YjbQ [Candidatus Binatus sp.]